MTTTSLVIQRVSRLQNIPTNRQFRRWTFATLAAIARPAEVTVRIVNASEARNLNAAFRGKDYATNVLTFSYHDHGAPVLLGDLVLCAQVVAQEARAQGKALADHYAHLTIHGLLHLAGFDHEKSHTAKQMESREVAILAGLGIANPYQDDT